MDIDAMIAKLSSQTGETADAITARLAEASGLSAEKIGEVKAAIAAQLAEGKGDARALFSRVAEQTGVGADKVTDLFASLKGDLDSKGLSGLWSEWTAGLDRDGDGSIMDDLKDRLAGLFGGGKPG